MSHNCCNDYTRSQLLRAAAAEAGKGLPAIEPGMPRAGRHRALARAAFLSRSAGLALAVYGASKIPLSAFENGIAQAAPSGPSPRLDLLRRRHRLAQRARPGRRLPLLRSCGRTWRSAPGAGTPFSEDPTPAAGTPRRRPWRPSTARARSRAFPAIGYDHPNQSHFTSRHFYEVGELDDRLQDRLARPLHRPGRRRREPAAGPLDGRLALADAGHRQQAGGGGRQRRRLRPLVARSSDPIEAEMFRSFASFGSLPLGLPRPRPGAAAPPPRPTSCAMDLSGVRRLHQPGRLPGHLLRPQARRPRRPTSPPACRCGR